MHPVTPDRLNHATTEAQVVDMVREYLSAWHPEELRDIPERCRPGKIRDAEDIGDCAFELTKARIASSGPEPLLVEMETFFANACTRISRLDRGTSRGDDAEPSSESA